MPETSFFTDMLQSITDRGRQLLFSGSRNQQAAAETDLQTLCEMLLSSRGEASGMALAAEILDRWGALGGEGAQAFLDMLHEKFGPDTTRLDQAIEDYRGEKSSAAIIALHQAAEPRRQELLRRLNHAPNGTAKLVQMRQHLLASEDRSEGYHALDADFTHLFGSWFNRGFLTLRPIDWSTPAYILEKIIKYEAVHEIAGWEELRRRLAPADRRCFAFFHPRLADEPLVFVEVALTRSVPCAIADVLDEGREQINPDEATTAVFYSISNCQDGLRGISFGNFLIKQVVDDLRRDLPGLKNFVTLSPVPGFARWLAKARASATDPLLSEAARETLMVLDDRNWPDNESTAVEVERVLLPLAAHYFLIERTPEGRPVDPVARFHLGNGARLERLNFLGDRSTKAMQQAHGLMVIYLYKLDDIVANHEALAQRGEVIASPAVKSLLNQNDESRRGGNGQQGSRPFTHIMNSTLGGGRK
ncbi:MULTISPECIES: malonyl-CoA decarboxylase [Rhizobium]|uniref:Malonyl-CoA decarboxylase n=1 Tax=Rhizobium favelukesii TaxID=348824 RepID=W6S1X0_9HYPH|nr:MULTISPECIES: malonyl-CoA decarboxylase [Rhizobium]MCS0462574.1 malonyl-CoA decarboxylase [Rhizobium favelukesii]UFS84737.1 malonyl-CoA decarboxylase [Rhizobium sp. T136]CDM60421.1 malonyl-CoA decarboxylase [Rhizobium favelukesii]